MMLSTRSLSDAISELLYGYSYYNYENNDQFERAIEQALRNVMLLDLIPLIGEEKYKEIKNKDKVGLTVEETYIYWSEINLACARVAGNGQESSNSMSFSVEGYSESRSESSSSNNNALVFYNKGSEFLANAGYILNAIPLR